MVDARALLIRQLQGAYSGELAAGFAYRGHWRSARDAGERERIRTIEEEEWHHRDLVRGLLDQLGGKPSLFREAIMWIIGRSLGFGCHLVGWFLPMYGAGKLERGNIVEYEVAAEYASRCGREDLVACLLEMAEVEWEHEKYFRSRIEGHPWTRVFRMWDAAPPKETIRQKSVA